MSFTKYLIAILMAVQSFYLYGQIPQGYYDDAQNKTGVELKIALYNIIDDHTSISYSDLWDAFYDSDRKPNGKVWDMYSDVPGGTPPYQYTFFSDQCGTYNSEGDCYNREHSFPKSWFNDASPMYSDMFHLVPTDGYVNGRRSNYPYGEVGNVTWTSQNGSKLGSSNFPGYSGTVFEPIDEYKGDFARGYFYMATRYHNVIANWDSEMLNGTSFPAFTTWAKNLLLQWHEQDPVSAKEIDRNNVIYASYQHNRNPFIDHPEYANLIWGTGTLPLAFTSSPITSVTVGQAYQYNITATGGTGTITITCSQKPDWISFSSNGSGAATLSGTPQAANEGVFPISLTATDQNGATVNQQFNLTVILPQELAFTSVPVLIATPDQAYLYQISAQLTNNPAAVITLTCEQKPQWLNFATSGNNQATLSGTPLTSDIGQHPITIKAVYGQQTIYQNFTIVVIESMAGGWNTEPFENMPEASSSYQNINWTGNYSINWTATNARTDQSIDDRAICLKNTSDSYVQSQTISGGCTKISFDHQQKFTGSGGTISLYINDQLIGDAVDVTSDNQTALFEGLTIEGDFVIKLVSNGLSRIAIDNLGWYTTDTENLAPEFGTIEFSPNSPTTYQSVEIQAQITDPEQDEIVAFIKWGYAEGNLTNAVAMTADETSFTGTIPPNEPNAVIFFAIEAYDTAGNLITSQTYSYTVDDDISIDEMQNNCSLIVSPNPASDHLKIANPCFNIEKISIYSVQGQLVYVSSPGINQHYVAIQIPSLKKGMYLLWIEGQNQKKSHKIIIQ